VLAFVVRTTVPGLAPLPTTFVLYALTPFGQVLELQIYKGWFVRLETKVIESPAVIVSGGLLIAVELRSQAEVPLLTTL